MTLEHRLTELHQAVASKPPRLVFIHGLAAHPDYWQVFQERMTFNGKIQSLLFPWGVRRDSGPVLSSDDDLSLLLIEGLNTDDLKNHVVICHSFGSLAMLNALCTQALTVPRALVLFSPFYRSDADSFDWARMSYYVNEFHLVLEEAIHISPSVKAHMREELVHDMALKVREWVGPTGWMQFFRTYMQTPGLNLHRIDCPVLIIGGQQDISAFPEDAQMLGAKLAHAHVHILQGAGHFPFITHVDVCAKLVNDFLHQSLETQLHGVNQ